MVPAQYARCHLGSVVAQADIFEVDLPEQSFDVITAWDVIEHVNDPRGMLSRCAQWLRPGGLMALRFPSAQWQKLKGVVYHQLLGSERAAFGATMHLTFFNTETFRRMAQEQGLTLLKSRTTPAEPNTNSIVLDAFKRASDLLVRAVEKLSTKQLGNLEVYCRRDSA